MERLSLTANAPIGPRIYRLVRRTSAQQLAQALSYAEVGERASTTSLPGKAQPRPPARAPAKSWGGRELARCQRPRSKRRLANDASRRMIDAKGWRFSLPAFSQRTRRRRRCLLRTSKLTRAANTAVLPLLAARQRSRWSAMPFALGSLALVLGPWVVMGEQCPSDAPSAWPTAAKLIAAPPRLASSQSPRPAAEAMGGLSLEPAQCSEMLNPPARGSLAACDARARLTVLLLASR